MPLAGLKNSGLPGAQGFKLVSDPYTGEEYVAVKAIKPDWAVIHVHEADETGNARIEGSKFEDVLLAKAAKKVLVTCERLVSSELFTAEPERTDLPGFLVTTVVQAPGGAHPCSCGNLYDYDRDYLLNYLKAAGSDESYRDFISRNIPGKGGTADEH